MITTTLPVMDKKIVNDKLETNEREITVKIDTSIFAEERWEENFPKLAERETLFSYVERVNASAKSGKPRITAELKALYCFIDSDELGDFKTFCQMFEISSQDYLDRLVKRITNIFEIALSSSMSTPKN